MAPHGGAGLSFQSDADYVPPVWPGRAGKPRMMVHLDIRVDGLDAEVARAVGLGARVRLVMDAILADRADAWLTIDFSGSEAWA